MDVQPEGRDPNLSSASLKREISRTISPATVLVHHGPNTSPQLAEKNATRRASGVSEFRILSMSGKVVCSAKRKANEYL